MITKNDLKYYTSLLQKKHRALERKFIAEGLKIIQEGLTNNWQPEIVFLNKTFADSNPDFINNSMTLKSFQYEILNDKEFTKLCDTVNPQGVAAVFNYSKTEIKSKANQIVALEDVSDPGNLGSIIRNCDWFNIKEIILSENCAELHNPKTIRSAMGSIFHLNIVENVDLISQLNVLKEKGYQITTSDLIGINVFEINPIEKSVIVFSNEAKGPSNELISISDNIIAIPKYGKAESLNVASASAIIIACFVNNKKPN